MSKDDHQRQKSSPDEPGHGYISKVIIALSIAVVVFFLLFVIWSALKIVLIIFAGVLAATFIRSLSTPLARITRLPHPLFVVLVIVGLFALFYLGGLYLSPRIAVQLSELKSELPDAIQKLQERIQSMPLGSELLFRLPRVGDLLRNKQVLQEVRTFFSVTVNVLSDVFIFIFITMYLTFDPEIYIRGFLRLIPPGKRERGGYIIEEMAITLRRWVLGTLITMASTGLITGVGLWLLGIPLALTLGLLAGLLTFIPYLGGIISAVPAVLLGLLQGPSMALYVAGIYLLAHTVEAYIVSPIVQQHQVHLPPVFTIVVQILLGYAIGLFGLMMATPLSAVVVVFVKMAYIEDVLGEKSRVKDGT